MNQSSVGGAPRPLDRIAHFNSGAQHDSGSPTGIHVHVAPGAVFAGEGSTIHVHSQPPKEKSGGLGAALSMLRGPSTEDAVRGLAAAYRPGQMPSPSQPFGTNILSSRE